MIRWFDPAFVSLTTSEDADLKHFPKYPYHKNGKHIGTAERFVGADVLDSIPGICWLTYLTPKVIGERLLTKLRDKVVRRDERGGRLVRAYENSSEIGSETARALEDEIIQVLGRKKFLDVKTWKPPESEVSEPASSTQH